MMRLILFAAFIAVIALAISVALGTMRHVAPEVAGKDNGMIPAKMRRVTYVLLVVLLFGVTSGWLGGT